MRNASCSCKGAAGKLSENLMHEPKVAWLCAGCWLQDVDHVTQRGIEVASGFIDFADFSTEEVF